MNLSITEYKPHPALAPYIDRYWMGSFNLSGSSNYSPQMLPNGCIELILHLSDDHCHLNKKDDSFIHSPHYMLLGMYAKPYLIKFKKRVNAFGIRFYPDGVRNILGVAPGNFLATFEDGFNLEGKALDEFYCKARESTSINDKLEMANAFFLKQLSENHKSRDNTHLAMQLIRNRNGLIDFSEITDTIPLSLRHLQREFKNTYGFSITEYIRLSRLNAINKYMLANNTKLTELAYKLEFTDQSHFIREFKHYVGIAPKKFMQNIQNFLVSAVEI